MFRKNYLAFLLIAAVFLIGNTAAYAQTAPVLGRVVLKKADGTSAPIADAVIDVYRMDIKGKLPSGKTNSKGEFSFAGIPLGGQFMFAVSAPGAKPDIFPGVRAGNDKITFTLIEGDGKRLTEDEARQGINAAPTSKPVGELTAEQKKAVAKEQAEYDKKVAEVTAKNTKSEETDKLVRKVLEEGSKAFEAKNYDLAVAKFDEGITADPDFAGSTPVLLNNKTAALINRAMTKYNQSVKGEPADRATAIISVKKDFEDAITASDRALAILKAGTAPDAANQKNYDANKFQALANRKEVYRLMVKTGADRTKGKEASVAFQEYLAVETDAKKKTDTQLVLGDVLRETGDSENAVAAYRNALETSPNNPDVLAGLGLSLFAAGAGVVPENKAQMQEGLNYMQRFTEVAPESHPLKASVKEVVDYLKSKELTPQKATKKKS